MANSRESTDQDKRLPKRKEMQSEAYDYTQSHEGGGDTWVKGKGYTLFIINILALLLFAMFVEYRFNQLKKEIEGIHNEIKVTPKIAKIKIAQNGQIYLNKQSITWEELSTELKRLQQTNGVVWYFADSDTANQTLDDMPRLKSIMEFGLPVRVLEKDFE